MNEYSDERKTLIDGGERAQGAHNPSHEAVEQFNQAIALVKVNDFSEAEKCLRTAIEIDPDIPEYHNRLSHLLANQGKTEEALPPILKALAINPENAHYWAHHAILLARSGDFDQAEALYRRAIVLDSSHAGFHRGLIDVLNKQSKHEEAQSIAQQALELHGGDAALKHQAAILAMRFGQLAEAERLLEDVVQGLPASHSAWNLYSHALARNGQYEKGLFAIEQALALQPNDAHYIAHNGNVLRYLGRMEEAQKLIERAIEVQPTVAGFYISLSELMDAKGNLDDAISAARRAVGCDPAHLGYQEYLDQLILRKNKILEEAATSQANASSLVVDEKSDVTSTAKPLPISSLQPPFRQRGERQGFWFKIRAFFRKIGF